MIIRTLILFLLSFPYCLSARNPNHVVVVLSLDGFRWDYPALYHTPNLDRIARSGCRAESLQPSYPTKTFPNHYTIVTGLHPDHHGIVQNSFYDPSQDRVFRMGDRSAVEDSVFWEGEAIWETAEKQGVKAASYFWVGTETNERFRPSYRKLYEDGFPYKHQIDTVMAWLNLPAESRPGLILFYFDQPDKAGHDYGPESRETKKVVRDLDRLVGSVVKKIDRISREKNLEIDFIVLSDHGMGYIPAGQQVFLENIVDLKKIRRINGGNPVLILEPLPEYAEEVYQALKATPNIKTWKKNELPPHYQYGTHSRIPELVVEAAPNWGLEIRSRKNSGKEAYSYGLGTHGYDPLNRDMHGIFFATGPSFRNGFLQPSFQNIHIYELLSRLLEIKPVKTDGSIEPVKGMLK
jgi:alkaline phosphatase D